MKSDLAAGTGAYYDGVALDETSFTLYGSPRDADGLAKLETAIDAEVARIQRDGVSADELERAKNRLVRGMIFAQDSPSSMANMYGSALTTGNTVKDVREWPDRIKAVTAEQVQAAAVKFLKSDQSVTAYLLASPETSN